VREERCLTRKASDSNEANYGCLSSQCVTLAGKYFENTTEEVDKKKSLRSVG